MSRVGRAIGGFFGGLIIGSVGFFMLISSSGENAQIRDFFRSFGDEGQFLFYGMMGIMGVAFVAAFIGALSGE